MKKTKVAVLLVSFLILFSSDIFGQLVSIGVGGGLTQVTGPEGTTKAVSEGGLGYSSEYNFGAIGKVDLPLVPITPRAFIIYHKFNGDGTFNGEQIENSQSILSLGVGASYNFIPVPAGVDPYIALDIMFNHFGEFSGEDYPLSKKSRSGLGIGAGAEVSLLPKINVDISASYRMFNLFGKDSGEETLSAVNLDLFLMFSLL